MKGQFHCPCCNQGDVEARIKGKVRMMERILGVDIKVFDQGKGDRST
jgi:hypothetical protein